ncbi:MAG TPA: WD40 repeat domain-containing protein [Gemmataceae bacterium]|nr:WD40 repeat domain-containing protein [Gemmataceae bacterium]
MSRPHLLASRESRRRGGLLLTCLAVMLSLGARGPAADSKEEKEIERLVQQLGSQETKAHQAAAKRLEEIGEAALPALRKAVASATDPDVKLRAGLLVKTIGNKAFAELRRFTGHSRQVHCVVLTRDGKHALTGSLDGTMRLWEVATGKELRKFEGHTGGVWGVAVSRDGKRAVTAGGAGSRGRVIDYNADRSVRLWDVATGKELKKFEGHTGQVRGVALSSDGKRIASAGQDGVRLWDAETGKELRQLTGMSGGHHGVVFTPDDAQVLAAGADGRLWLWDASDGKEVSRLEGHGGWVMGLAIAPDGRRALSAGADKTMRLWDLKTGKELRRFQGHATMVLSVAFSPDGRRALSGSGCTMQGTNRFVPAGQDYTVRLWDVETGAELHNYEGHSGPILGVSFAPDGLSVFSASGDNTVHSWRAPPAPAKKSR